MVYMKVKHNDLADKIKQLDAIEFFILSAVQGIEALQKDYSANIANAMNSNGSLMQNPPSPFYLEGQAQLIFLLESIIKQILEFESKVFLHESVVKFK